MILEKINSIEDLRKLNIEQLVVLAQEVRCRMVEVVSVTGGHLASSLGAVELIIALHYCLNTPKDKIIFDVGHQAYAHKILTGRNKDFTSLRQYQGISGFPSKDESEFDPFTTGHSSAAVSIALGLACAQGDSPSRITAVIGDGSLSGGLCFEGLNNAGHLKKDLLVILNTNEMSIAANAGALSTYLNKIISLPIYNRFRDSLENFVQTRLPKGSRLIKLAAKFEEGLKGLFIPGMLFEELGFRYFGPLNGHDLGLLIKTIRNIMHIRGPVMLHVVTKKGKGYLPAESDPVRFHGTGPFDLKTGAISSRPQVQATKSYTDIFSNKLVELAASDKKIVAITAAMPEGTGLDKFRKEFPERFFDCGIAEGHAICFAAGLAKAGFKPVVAIYSTFLQRGYDQIIEEVALQNLPVVLAIDRAGITGEDGATHQGILDIGFLNTIPNLTLMSPSTGMELEKMLDLALRLNKPVALRYPRALAQQPSWTSSPLEFGRAEVLTRGEDFALFALGSMVLPCFEAVKLLQQEGLSGTLVNARFSRPLDLNLFQDISKKTKFIFSIEEAIVEGGFGSAISSAIDRPVEKIGLPCEFIPHGKRSLLLEKYGLTSKLIADKIKSICQR